MLFRILKKDMMRKKVMNLILLLFIILASMFVASGLSNVATVLSGTDFYLDKAGIGDYMVITGGDGAYSALDDFLKNDKDIKGYRMEHLIFSSKEDILLEEKESVTKNTSILVSVDEDGIDYFDKDNNVITSVQPGHVYVPLAFLEENDLKAGDKLRFKKESVDLEFIIDGNFKDALLGSPMMGNTRFLISGEDMKKVTADPVLVEKYGGEAAYIETDDVETLSSKLAEIDSITFDGSRSVIKLTYVMSLIVAFVVLILSLALIIVAFVVLKFAISMSVMEDFHEIGVMKAIGMRNGRIRGMYAAKYLTLALIGAVIGGALSFPFGEMLIQSVSENMYLGNESDVLFHIVGTILVILIISGFAWFCTRRVRKLSPVDAIRSGQTGERFHKKKGRGIRRKGNTQFALAINDIRSNPRRYLSIFLSIFVCTLLVLLIVNTTVTMKSDTFLGTFGAKGDVYVEDVKQTMKMQGSGRKAMDEFLEKMKTEITDAGMPCETSIEAQYKYKTIVNGKKYNLTYQQGINTKVAEYDYLSGTAPQNANEVAVTEQIMEKTGLKVGDTFTVDFGDRKEDFLVTATYQTMNQMGEVIRIHEDTKTDFNHFSSSMNYCIRFTDHPDQKEIDARKAEIARIWGVDEKYVFNASEYCVDSMGVADTMETVQNLLLIITLIVIMLVTILMERSFAADEKTQIALLKAVGFRNGTIVRWHVWRFGICGAFAVILALLLSVPMTHLCISPIFNMMGTQSVDYRYNLTMTAVYPIIIFGFTVLISFLVAQCVRKIKASDTANIE